MTATSPAPTRSFVVPAAILDLVALIVFVAIGRSNHDEPFSVGGFATTLWPFVVGAALGWAFTWVADRSAGSPWSPARPIPHGVIIWVSTILIGMLLRWITDQGTAGSFIIVASVATAVLLLGWRLIALIVGRIRR